MKSVFMLHSEFANRLSSSMPIKIDAIADQNAKKNGIVPQRYKSECSIGIVKVSIRAAIGQVNFVKLPATINIIENKNKITIKWVEAATNS